MLGPEINGGIYLIGIRSPFKKNVFKGVRWSTSYSFEDLQKNFSKSKSFSLELSNDLNMPADIIKLKDEIYYNCPILYDFLKRRGYYVSLENKYIDFDSLSISIPVVSNLVQRQNNGEIEVLIQTRYKPTIDPENTGKIEIPSGLLKRYEPAQEAALRETKEETGIICQISEDQQIVDYITKKNVEQIALYRPFCCHQQLKGGRAYISIGFISNYKKGELKENLRENRNPRWVSISKIKKLVKEKPNDFFALSLAMIKEYLNYKNYNP